MFTGLIQDIGIIRSIDNTRGDLQIEIETNMDLSKIQIGASISCSGCCLTVVNKSDNSFFVDVSAETLSKTIIGTWRVLSRINLEPSLKVGDEIGGHFVSGHVDATTKILEITKEGDSRRIKIAIPPQMESYLAAKGSITIDGISLTVNEVDDAGFGVNIIPHTWNNTTLSDRIVGDYINIEIDMLARYIVRQIECEGLQKNG